MIEQCGPPWEALQHLCMQDKQRPCAVVPLQGSPLTIYHAHIHNPGPLEPRDVWPMREPLQYVCLFQLLYHCYSADCNNVSLFTKLLLLLLCWSCCVMLVFIFVCQTGASKNVLILRVVWALYRWWPTCHVIVLVWQVCVYLWSVVWQWRASSQCTV